MFQGKEKVKVAAILGISKVGMLKALVSNGSAPKGCELIHSKDVLEVLEQVLKCLPLANVFLCIFPPYLDFGAIT